MQPESQYIKAMTSLLHVSAVPQHETDSSNRWTLW